MRLYAERLGDALARRGIDVHRVRVRPALPDSFARATIAARIDSLWGRFIAYPRAARGVRADVYHVADHAMANVVDVLDPARTVVTCHDLILLATASGRLGPRPRSAIATAIFRRIVARLRRVATVVADSEHTRRDVLRELGVSPDRIEVIPPGLNGDFRPRPELREGARRRFGMAGPAVIHVGHTSFYKNIEGCLRVLAMLRKGGIDAVLYRAGESLRPEQRALAARLGVAEHVRELDKLSGDDLALLYVAADVLLFPSLYEGFGWPPLEAMASGLPVVCSSAGSLREVVGDGALTAAPDDHVALSDLVASVLTDPLRAAALRERGMRVAARYSWDTCAERVSAVYARITDSAPADPSPPRSFSSPWRPS
jgi:glycosyltransferase involved in cell wall biosynthesis